MTRVLTDTATVTWDAGTTGQAKANVVPVLSISSISTSATITGTLTAGAFSYGTLPYSASGNFASFNVGVDSYSQIIISNSNNTATASANVIVSNNAGTDTQHYGAFGINSSSFADGGVVLNKADYTYLSCATGDLAIGTITANAFHMGAGANWTSDAITISSGNIPSLFSPQVLNGNLMTAAPANGQACQILSLTELTVVAAAATTTCGISLPANAIIIGVSTYVQTVIPTATSFTVGDGGSAARFNTASVAVAAGSSDVGTKAGSYYNATSTPVVLTMAGGTPAANSGRVRTTIHYISVTAPTS